MSDLLRVVRRAEQAVSHRESDDNYKRVVARLNPHWRVVRCKDDIQWIIQKRDGFRNAMPRWTERSFCVEPASVQRLVLKHCGIVDAAELKKVFDLGRGGNRHDK